MRKTILAILLIFGFAVPAAAHKKSEFVMCRAGNAFADCTKAQCTGPTGGPYTCSCVIRSAASAMSKQPDRKDDCVKATDTTVQSRFAPIKFEQLCGPDYQGKKYYPDWAWCMAVMCNKTGRGTADCACTAPPAGATHPYVIVRDTNSYDAKLCIRPANVWSSATRGEAASIQRFMRAPPVVVTNPKH
jgi:hypothetical protein